MSFVHDKFVQDCDYLTHSFQFPSVPLCMYLFTCCTPNVFHIIEVHVNFILYFLFFMCFIVIFMYFNNFLDRVHIQKLPYEVPNGFQSSNGNVIKWPVIMKSRSPILHRSYFFLHILIIFHWLNLTYHLRSLLLPRLHLHFYSLGLFILPKIMYILLMNIKIWPQLLIFFLLHQFRPKYCIGTCFFVLNKQATNKQRCWKVKN